ncbi:DUF4214 domain-containing protein [Candidatus Arthromitus sp. SFB-rat-Yit]|uniref:DUF4214 domain-containing protein n=1 Tax=Candidatus Arthromitus sp. SFB-rat-Yit TaxID=1041504 RepID=UPI0002E6D75C|nr:DUF4214 domain-containing protein [Candidatus Arthromitus sp. SFB-rat-Yit]
MKSLFKMMIRFVFFVILCLNLCIKVSYTLDKIDVPIYIVESGNFVEIVVDDAFGYEINKVSLKDLISGNEIKINEIDKRFFIYDKLEDGTGYEIKISLIDRSSFKTINQVSKFKYLNNSFDVNNIGINTCDVMFKYDKKNLIFINGIELYGKKFGDEGKEDRFDFHIKKSKKEINNLRNIFKFNNISLHPSTTYDIRYVINLKDNVNLVFDKHIKTKDFDILDMSSKMINNNQLELKWDVTSNNFKFINNDSINIYIKGKGDINYSVDPDIRINDEKVNSTVIELKELSPIYDIKLAYKFGDGVIEKEIGQTNDCYNLNTDIKIKNLRDLFIQFDFIKNLNFKSGDRLNIYIEEKDDKLSRKKVRSIDLKDQIQGNSVDYKNLKTNTEYSIDYEILNSYDESLIIKNETFRTLPFEIKNISAKPIVDSDGNLNVKLRWEITEPNFRFGSNDSLKVFIKEKNDSEYPNDSQFYANRDLSRLGSCILNLGRDINKEYDFKFVYDIDGKEYVSYGDLKNNALVRTQSEGTSYSNGETNNTGEANNQNNTVKVSIKDKKVNEVIFQLEYSEDFTFEEGDSIRLFKKLRNGSAKNFSSEPDKEYIHASNGENQIDLKNIKEVSIGYLIPEKEYDFKIEFKTKNELKDKDTIIESGSGDGSSGGSGSGSDTGGGSTGGGTESGGEDSGSNGDLSDGNGSNGDDNQENGEGSDDSSSEEEEGDEEETEDSEDVSTGTEGSEDSGNTGTVEGGGSSEETGKTEETEEEPSSSNKKYSVRNTEERKTLEKTFENQKTSSFTIDEFKTTSIRPNSVSFEWKVSGEPTTFDEKDKVEIYIKRKIVNGYPAGSSFSKVGSEVSGVFKGDGTVTYMDMDYTAKLVYTISNVKFEKTVEFKTTHADASIKLESTTEYYAILNIAAPQDYIFANGDYVEIYVKKRSDNKYPKEPNIISFHGESNKLEDLTKFNILPVLPDMDYDVLLTYKTKANDIEDKTMQFRTKKLEFSNCRIDSMKGNTLRIKTDFGNDMVVMDYLDIYVDTFYKLADHKQYNSDSIFSGSRNEIFDFECTIPDNTKDYDLLISYNPHGYFNEVYFVDFELEYRGIKPTVEEGEKYEDEFTKSTFDLKWSYGENTKFLEGDKLNIYLKTVKKAEQGEENEDSSNEKKESDIVIGDEYVKIHTIESDIISVTSFNLDQFLTDDTDYIVMIEPVTEKFTIGAGKTEFYVEKIIKNEPVDETIFEQPVEIERFDGIGNQFAFPIPDLGDISLTEEMDILCDIDGISARINEDGNIGVEGLVPGKEYPSIEVRIVVEEGKEIIFNIQNIILEAENPRQSFLYNVYDRAFLRAPDELGYDYWINRLNNQDIGARDFLINLLFAEKEFSELEYTTDKLIEILYSIVVDRDPDEEGLRFWIDFYNNESLVNANGDVFNAKKHVVDRMINEEEFMKMVVGMGLKY